ncbi:hypothetical protein MNBD_GAMMA12-2658 [hydrothermal vent metagenome]|uniref:SnoaL-like domain-containing protein n=1 Tax=hydrothermal vent metagenome TaxID=652676 RepID=A0A3B0YNT6_9ZZZZ
MKLNKKERICQLLKGIETGNPESVSVVNEAKYIQHNPQTHEGSEGLAALFKRLAAASPRVNIVRVFEDGNFVFAHTEHDFSERNIGFEIFRFESEQAVEHWDNIQQRENTNHSGHSMVDGQYTATDHDMTECNRAIIKSFTENILIQGNVENLSDYLNYDNFIEHSPYFSDNVDKLITALSIDKTDYSIDYNHCHHLLAGR